MTEQTAKHPDHTDHSQCGHSRGWWPCLAGPETPEEHASRMEEVRRIELGAELTRADLAR